MKDVDDFIAWLHRQGKPQTRALRQWQYGDPAKHIRFDREKGKYMDQIKELLREWASWHIDKRHGWPTKVAFATERVQASSRVADDYTDQMPPVIKKLNDEVERLAPGFKRIVALEYLDRRPQKTKAALLGIPRQVFSQRLLWIHEQLSYAMGLTVAA